MGKVLKRLPSPSMAVAFVALLAALTGTAVALPGSNTVTSGDIKNSQVKTQDIRNSTIRGGDVRNSTIRGTDVGANSLTGSDIDEGSLGTVPSANTANSANTASTAGSANAANTANSVGGVALQRFRYRTTADAAESTILSFGGLVLRASCASATMAFEASTTVDDAHLNTYSVDTNAAPPPPNANVNDNTDLDTTETVNLVPNDEDNEIGHLRYSKPDGGGVHVQWHAHTSGTGTDCAVNGVASAF